jgi:2-polyprenyl-3-methyl-5-hydroxy-6-metoxy-1,4-benzoquinol methylase
MRYITKRLGDLNGKTLLDIGRGLGEASVYFAMKGAEVTSSDLSEGMLNVTTKLALENEVKVKTHLRKCLIKLKTILLMMRKYSLLSHTCIFYPELIQNPYM